MASLNIGKDIICDWIRLNFDNRSSVLDVGACDGKWKRLLREYDNMDAVEIFPPNIFWLGDYRNVYEQDIYDFKYDWYDLIIFGDVIEHMDVPTAQKVLAYAATRCKDMIVAVPYEYPQGAIYGNPWEIHKQADLTPEIFAERYPDLEVLHDTGARYCFYHRKQPKRRVKNGEKRTKNV